MKMEFDAEGGEIAHALFLQGIVLTCALGKLHKRKSRLHRRPLVPAHADASSC
jgi:hypothetical protein